MSGTNEELGALLSRARRDGPTPARLAEVRARLESQLGPLDAPPRPTSVLGPKLLLGAVTVLALVAALLWPGPGPEPARSSVEPAAVPAAREVPPAAERAPDESPPIDDIVAAEDEAMEEAATPAIPPDDRVAPRRTARPTEAEAIEVGPPDTSDSAPESASTLREEIALLDRALRAREAGELARARETLEEHRARFPAGRMSPERDRMLREIAAAAPAPP